MTTVVRENPVLDQTLAAGRGGAGALSERDLVELLGAFDEATSRLQTAHDVLHREVARLKGELREANERLERSRRLAALGEMAAGIAHEVRNPLGGIRLYAGMLEEDLADRPACRDTARKIISAVRGLDAVVCDVLAFAREMVVRPTAVPADDLLGRAAEEGLAGLGRLAAPRVRISVDGEGVLLTCDPALMHRALVNLVRNAAEAVTETGREGAVSLVARHHSDADGRRWARVAVADTGPGIPEGVKERMFNPFFTTRATGTGLGLSIVHRISDAHGGRVEVRNRSAEEGGGGGGAVVELMWPDGGAGT